MRLKCKIVIVTGAAQGIGRGIADRFVKEGALVAIVDYKSAVTLLDGQRFYQGDVSDPELWKRVVSELLNAHGRIDVLVNNAAIVQYEAVHEVELKELGSCAGGQSDGGHAGHAGSYSRYAGPRCRLDHQPVVDLGQRGRARRRQLPCVQSRRASSHKKRGGDLRQAKPSGQLYPSRHYPHAADGRDGKEYGCMGHITDPRGADRSAGRHCGRRCLPSQ
jgi:hypothetical protein